MKSSKKTLFYTIITLVFIFVLHQQAHTKDFNLAQTSIQTLHDFRAGLGSQGVNDVLQTHEGYIWVATYSGLFRYDGKSFLRIDTSIDKDFTSSSINKLFLASDGTLYIGSNDKGLFKYSNGDFSQVKYYSNVLSTSIRDIEQDNEGTIYVSTSYGMGKIQNNALQSAGRTGLYIISVTQFTFDDQNRLWGVVSDGSIVIAKDDNIIYEWDLSWDYTGSNTFRLSDALMTMKKDGYKYTSSSIATLNDGNLLIGTNEGSVLKVKFDKEPIILNNTYDIALAHNNGFLEDKAGKIWSFSNLGIGYLTKDLEFVRLGGMKSDIFIKAIYEDHEDNLWIASQRDGLLHVKKSYFYEEAFPKNNNTFVSANTIWNGDLYIATDQGVVLANNVGSNTVTNYFDGIRVSNLMVDSENNLWVGSYSAYNLGLVKFTNNSKIYEFTTDNGLSNNLIKSIYEKSDGTFWIGTKHGLNVIKDNAVIENYFENDTLLNQSILSMLELKNGNMLIGTEGNGIFELSGGVIVKQIRNNDGLNSNIILRMAQDPVRNIIFISTGANTLNTYDPKTGTIGTISNFVANGNIHDIILAPNDYIIILSENNVYRTTIGSLIGANPVVDSYGFTKGLVSPVSAMSWNTFVKPNTLYLCASNNLYSINFNQSLTTSPPSRVAITSLEIDTNKIYEHLDSVVLEPENNRLGFNFAYLTFDNEEESSISYKLENFDKEFISIGYNGRYSVEYTNLPYGNYTFRVMGNNLSGGKSINEIIVPVTVRAYWYETTETKIAFFTLIILISIVSTVMIYHKRLEKMIKKNNALRSITKQFMLSFSRIIDAKDTYTNGHSVRVAYYSVKIMEKIEKQQYNMDTLYYTALLHDVGKVGVSDTILTKSTKLEQDEYEIIQKHTIIGANILEDIDLVKDVALGAKYHHEKYDGSGYPQGLAGEDIPLLARIICVADAFDAMTSGRSYANNTITWGLEELQKFSGSHFDPMIVDIFVDLVKNNKIHVYDGSADLKKFSIDLIQRV